VGFGNEYIRIPAMDSSLASSHRPSAAESASVSVIIRPDDIADGTTVYAVTDLAHYVFGDTPHAASSLFTKGTDASDVYDEEELATEDFSDDEAEAAARAAAKPPRGPKAKRAGRFLSTDESVAATAAAPSGEELLNRSANKRNRHISESNPRHQFSTLSLPPFSGDTSQESPLTMPPSINQSAPIIAQQRAYMQWLLMLQSHYASIPRQ
jgi:hypothetical protein